jgi:hypothetical protein
VMICSFSSMGYLLDFQRDFALNIIHRVKFMPQTGKNKLECLIGKNGLSIFSNYDLKFILK